MNKIAQAAAELFKQPLETTGYKYVAKTRQGLVDPISISRFRAAIYAAQPGYRYFTAGHIEHDKNGMFFRKAGTAIKSTDGGVFMSLPQAVCILLNTNGPLDSIEITFGLFGADWTETEYRYVQKLMRDLRFLGFVKIERCNLDRRFRVYSLTPEMAECPLYKIYPPIYKNDQE